MDGMPKLDVQVGTGQFPETSGGLKLSALEKFQNKNGFVFCCLMLNKGFLFRFYATERSKTPSGAYQQIFR